MEAVGPFTCELWKAVHPIYEQIINYRYVKLLAEGTLPRNDEMYFFLQLAKDGLDIERALNNDFFNLYSIPKTKEKSPAFNAYTDFLLNHAFHSPYPVAVAALLPCFWIYMNTGEYILKHTVANNPYQKWIDTYSGEEYRQYTNRFIHIMENIGQKAESAIKEQILSIFIEGAKHELYVFEEATKQ
jgi:thiaminase/transcriptional activator TenA